MSVAIKVENLSKKYVIRHENKTARYDTLSESLINTCQNLVAKLRHPFDAAKADPQAHEEFWALKDLNFEITHGDRVGIIGRNGAGKSTLLKVLSRITEPTRGRIYINGRIASLLEVGTGFHPELSGRENIYLNGAILGMSRKETKIKFDEIVAFAEVEKFLDTPVKRYSSGMYVRLAFSVAAHLEPEILVVDEVLAVGDAQFQKKSLGKMKEVGNEGRTVLFVSHNMGAINTLCNKAILLDEGALVLYETVDEVISKYMHHKTAESGCTYVNDNEVGADVKAGIIAASILGPEGKPTHTLLVDQVGSIHLTWKLNVSVTYMRIGVEIIDSAGAIIFSSMDTDSTDWLGKLREPGIYNEIMTMPAYMLMPGLYTVKVFAGMPGVERFIEMENILQFEVADNQSHISHVPGENRSGYIAIPMQWEVKYDGA